MGTSLTRFNPGRARRISALVVSGLMVLGAAASTKASEVVDLRIGAHQDFTRIVFELDRPTGYRIERASPRPGVSELVVSIDATSIPRKVKSKNDLIGMVTITPKGKSALAEIQLSREGLRLKEMILSSPPRIVLDILDSPAASSASPAVAKKTTKPKAPAKPVAKPTPKPKAKPKAQPSPVRTRVVSVPAPKPKAKPAAAAKETKVVVRTVPAEAPIPPTQLAKPRRAEPAKGARKAPLQDPQEPMGRNLAILELEAEEVVRVQPDPERVLEQFKAPEEEESGNGLLWASLVGIVVLGAIVVARRRRRGYEGSDELDEGVEVGGAPPESENPFAARPTLVKEEDAFVEQEVSHVEAVADIELDLGDIDDEGEKEEAPVDAHLFTSDSAFDGEAESDFQDLVSESNQGGDEETHRLLAEFERRAETLERRLEEASEARERLERQVAAQTEELRVQRAAIARTQRAVRNMNRPDDQSATEPTPRDS